MAGQYLHLLPPGFSCVTTITMSFLANGYTVKYVPIDYAAAGREARSSTGARTRSRYLVQVVRLVLSYNPLRFFGPIGFAARRWSACGKLGCRHRRQAGPRANTLLVIFAAFQVLVIGPARRPRRAAGATGRRGPTRRALTS